jgi:hypothetical protein
MTYCLRVLFCSFVVLIAVSSTQASAADSKPGSGPNPYTDCGIGAALFKETHWAAVTSNVIWDLGTTAITSATASPQTCSGKKVAAAKFIIDTYTRLVEEAAAGRGENLSAALDIFECGKPNRGPAIQQIRRDMGKVVSSVDYPSAGVVDRAAALFNVMDTAVRNHCTA